MKQESSEGNKISRRKLFPLLAGTLLLPLLGFSNVDELEEPITDDKDYETLLKPDGTAVKVKTSTLKNAKVIKKNVSNKSLLHWIGKKF